MFNTQDNLLQLTFSAGRGVTSVLPMPGGSSAPKAEARRRSEVVRVEGCLKFQVLLNGFKMYLIRMQLTELFLWESG